MGGSARHQIWSDRRGNLSITTALVGTLLMTAVGASLDGGRMITTKMQLQSISDAAALMAATPENVSVKERHGLAANSVKSHAAKRGDLRLKAPDIAVRNGGKTVDVGLTAEVPLLFGAFLGGSTRYVSVKSTAEETTTSSMNAVSISVILDLSDSMQARFDTGSRINAVKTAISDTFRSIQAKMGGEGVADAQFSTGLYPFNWGMVYDETVSLTPGSADVMTEIVFTSTDDGSVPTTAWEMALKEQMDAKATEGARDRFIVYLTDGNVDDEKDDADGRMMRDTDQYNSENTRDCRKALEKQDKAYEDLVKAYVESYDKVSGQDRDDDDDDDDDDDRNRSLANTFATQLDVQLARSPKALIPAVTDHLDRYGNNANRRGGGDSKHIRDLKRELSHLEKADEKVIRKCEPVQTTRVIEACKTSRQEDISIIAVDLTGKDEEARQITDLCAGLWSDDVDEEKDEADETTEEIARPGKIKRLPGGTEVRISDDGKAMSASVSSLEELRDVLATMLPEAGDAERSVRLVN